MLQRTEDDPVQPADVLARSFEELRGCGFSGMKVDIHAPDLLRFPSFIAPNAHVDCTSQLSMLNLLCRQTTFLILPVILMEGFCQMRQ